ncbi:conjugal transfer protein TraR [Superficieibacter electus]|uniref:Conjugal transfer protein TraR n=1 Tax=Superficieibacter electus TaxID=2022662 RepID=A0A2P5GSU8_9ENTR|nr:TraR/DksA family transcriptional regulator [Superficieibacter electus]POP46882.1 conjugal transfer protein TraR [Superficieibacter electus]POP49619.1 conjugal transfer protein TraR [Superficieibacter electus]
MPSEIIDAANELVQQRIDMVVASHRINHNAVSATHCIQCGEKISDKRREAVKGCTMCHECQGIAELKRKQRGF